VERGDTRGRGRRGIVQMVVVGAVATALGIALGLAIDWFPAADSTQADKIDTLWDVLVIASVPIFVLVTVVVVFAVVDFRMRPGEESLDGPPVHGNTRLEVIWTAIPALLILGLCTYAYVVLTDIEEAPASGTARERKVVVTGQQFTWTFSYDESGKRFSSPQLYLPAGQDVKFIVRSRDVIHDFWVPDFRMKIDAVPGIDTTYRVTVKGDAVGDHDIVCAELCGLGHAYMRQTAHVMSGRDFAAWVARQGQAGAAGAGGGGQQGGGRPASGPIPAAQAKALFVNGDQQAGATACGACHTLAAAGTSAQTGPDLGTALKGKDLAFIKQSIENPDAEIASGYQKGIMPPNYAQTLSRAQLDGLERWLQEVAAK
jgi:cytochrome c oxidase subunit II